MARVIGTIGADSQFARAARKKGLDAVVARSGRLAELAAQIANGYAAAESQARSGHRHKPGPHLAGGFRGVVVSAPAGRSNPVTVAVRSIADSGKVNALESGAREHGIDARNGTDLIFPGTKRHAGKRVVVPHVDHPGNAPHHFMQRGMDEAIQREFAGAIRRSDARRFGAIVRGQRAARG